MVRYISEIQPSYGISRHKYYDVIKENEEYYIINDYKNKIYYTKEQLKKLYKPVRGWNDIFKEEKLITHKNKKKNKERD